MESLSCLSQTLKKGTFYIYICYFTIAGVSIFLTMITRVNNRLKSVPNWYVGKLLFFFEFDLEITETNRRHGSFYALVEVMKFHKTALHSTAIPMVQPFSESESKKYAILDAADITSVVGLIQKTELKNNQVESSNWFYVISPSTAFHLDMSTNAGKITDLL